MTHLNLPGVPDYTERVTVYGADRIIELTFPSPYLRHQPTRLSVRRAGENRLFLYNEPGRLLRIRPTPTGPEPFNLEATFTWRIPNVDKPDRLWVDPGREPLE